MIAQRLRFGNSSAAICALLALVGCDVDGPPLPVPQERPATSAPPANAYVPPSAQSQDLARYYEKVQGDLLTRGLLRTDGGGPDTPYDAQDLVRNFETIAFYSEYSGQSVSSTPRRTSGRLSRWVDSVRISVDYGPSVPPERRQKDSARVKSYAARLSRVTGHPISTTDQNSNFHVFIAGDDDTAYVQDRLRQLIPNIGQAQLDLFNDLPRAFYCFVFASAGGGSSHTYTRAVALIRAEHPDLVRLSCIHEEIAQGLGLPNDSPAARPSIFNDDDEFALLTSHDEKLLMMLYDPRLKPGMTAAEARPVTEDIARELMGQPL